MFLYARLLCFFTFFTKKNIEKICFCKKCTTFASQLADGVMVTLQILVLSFKVRVLVGQQKKHRIAMLFLYISLLKSKPFCYLPVGSKRFPVHWYSMGRMLFVTNVESSCDMYAGIV